MKKKYKLISEDLQKNLVEFLDEIQFEAAGNKDKDSMHKINFCSWAINELLESFDAYVKVMKIKNQEKIMWMKHLWIGTYLKWMMRNMKNL